MARRFFLFLILVTVSFQFTIAQNDLPANESPAKESIRCCEVILSSAKNFAGNNVRVIITRPLRLKGKAPVLMFRRGLAAYPWKHPIQAATANPVNALRSDQ